jgi:energy-coupling factor transporter ATP-binding protein EcfA2
MLKRLHVRNFTVFEDAEFNFSPGLNVLIGANGTGKTHVLKLGYLVEAATPNVSSAITANQLMFEQPLNGSRGMLLTSAWTAALMPILKIFQVRSFGQLVRSLYDKCDISVTLGNTEEKVSFQLGSNPSMLGVSEGEAPVRDFEQESPVFIPAKEVLTMMPDIVGLSKQYPSLLDATYTNLASSLTIRLQSEPPAAAQPVIHALGEAMGGTIKAENGRFYLQPAEGEPYEIGLVAEGFRKLGTLAYLLGNGTLTKETTLYWDEPEANLNPALLRQLATLLVQLAAQGFQIILATHSLFLLKEFHILSQQSPAAKVRYFGLNERPGKGVEVTMTHDLEQLPDIAALDAELDLADRFQEVLDREDANDN